MQDREEELRLALVMNGGVSLAVWMGGVSNEIFRLVTRQHPVYRRLLEMTRTTARVDVVSGASAGGVNGAALATALLYGGDFSALRQVWLETGAFGDLLRKPFGDNPGSLLRGDDFFLPQIDAAFRELAPQAAPQFSVDEMPIDLRLMTTLLAGRQGHAVDDLGSKLHDVDYRAHFLFRHGPNAPSDFLRRDAVLPSLARAARSTASFPFAFEPSHVGKADFGLRDATGAKLPTPRYVIDGGVLDNKPFRGALQAIFDMPTTRRVRRVLAYINPDPGDGPPLRIDPDNPLPPPPMASVVSSALFGIPMSQTIADQLKEIQAHNEGVQRRRDSVATIARLHGSSLARLPAELFPVYRRRRLQNAFDNFFLGLLAPAANRRWESDVDAGQSIGRRGRQHLETIFVGMPWRAWVPAQWPEDPCDRAYAETTWGWGMFPVEFAARLLLGLLRRAESLADFHPVPRPVPAAGAVTPPPHDGGADWQDGDWEPDAPAERTDAPRPVARRTWFGTRLAAPPRQEWATESLRASLRPRVQQATLRQPPASLDDLAACWDEAYACIAALRLLRTGEDEKWAAGADALLGKISDAIPTGSAAEVIGATDFEALFGFISTPERVAACGALAHRIARAIQRTCELAGALLDVGDEALLSPADRDEISETRALVAGLADDGRAPCVLEALLQRIMRFEVIEFAFNDHEDMACDSTIELVQVSGNGQSPLCRTEVAATDKLLGLQLAHFGAFYKRSWRANDWVFGRLDGAERLARILLDAERLRRFYRGDAARAFDDLCDLAWRHVPSRTLRREIGAIWAEEGYADRMREELAFLDRPGAPVPDTLPACAAAVTIRLHFGILREELPQLLAAIDYDIAQGGDSLGASQALRAMLAPADGPSGAVPFSPEQARIALGQNLIGGESLTDEAGSDLFTRTIAHTAATTQSLLASKAASLGPASAFFATLKLPFLGFYLVARGLTRQSRTSAALHAGILAVGLAIIAIQLGSGLTTHHRVLADPVATTGWMLFAYGLLMAVVRAPRTVGMALLVVLAVTALKFEAWSVVTVLVVAATLASSVRWPPLVGLQWLVGFALVLLAAGMSVDTADIGPAPTSWNDWPGAWRYLKEWLAEPVMQLALMVCAALSVAMWQTTAAATRLEHAARRLLRRRR